MVKSLRNGLGKRLSRCAPLPRLARTGCSASQGQPGQKNRASTAHPEAVGCILQSTGKPKRKSRLSWSVDMTTQESPDCRVWYAHRLVHRCIRPMAWMILLFVFALSLGTPAKAQPVPDATKANLLTRTKTGYVAKYTIALRSAGVTYFTVTISESQSQALNEADFVLSRDVLSDQGDKSSSGGLLAVPLATVSAGAIATIKDAAFAGKKVAIEYLFSIPRPTSTPAEILAVTLLNR